MQPKTQMTFGGILLAAALASANAASAQEALSSAPPAAQAEVDAVLSLEDLEALAGGTGVTLDVVTDQTLTAINSGNTVSGQTVGSGDISMAANALSSFDGVGNFVMNTGHNNNLQSSLNVTVVLAP